MKLKIEVFPKTLDTVVILLNRLGSKEVRSTFETVCMSIKLHPFYFYSLLSFHYKKEKIERTVFFSVKIDLFY